jgi:protein-arginine kinase
MYKIKKQTETYNEVKTLKDQNLTKGDVPLGLGMALAQNLNAMKYFTSLPEEERTEIIKKAHYVKSREEMANFVDALAKKNNNQTFV